MSKLILIRHGESMWNNANLFTGWVDIPLTLKGIQEALEAGKRIQDIPIDHAFTSTLVRAQETLAIALASHKSGKTPVFLHPEDPKLSNWETIYGEVPIIPVHRAWQLNERMYGELQGLNKLETKKKFGEEQVQIWRRSYAIAPPDGESLKTCAARTIPYFTDVIIPCLEKGENVLIVAHGNSLRSIVMHLDQLTEDQVVKLEMVLGEPVQYTYEAGIFSK
jgi:2,3-bisphosphoglycerate-dependent phosphoglycerate mutase